MIDIQGIAKGRSRIPDSPESAGFFDATKKIQEKIDPAANKKSPLAKKPPRENLNVGAIAMPPKHPAPEPPAQKRSEEPVTVKAVGSKRELAQQLVIVRMRADPEPGDGTMAWSIYPYYAMMETNARRPEAPNLLESERWMSWLGLEQLELLVRQFPNVLWKGSVARPEGR